MRPSLAATEAFETTTPPRALPAWVYSHPEMTRLEM